MRVELFPFQQRAISELRKEVKMAFTNYANTSNPQVIAFTAPTGAGKTIIMAALMESIFQGNDEYLENQQSIFVWLSDSPELNEQSRLKIDRNANQSLGGRCVTISEESFDKEMLDDGHIYFLNTQKLGRNSRLTQKGDARRYTIWETLSNTIRAKNDRLCLIIDEAHRGAQGNDMAKATTIMQKFIKGSAEDGIPQMPIVIGMSATIERFTKLVEGVGITLQRWDITPEEVRDSGLLKDKIFMVYPFEDTSGKEMAVLEAAALDWKEKWYRWKQYCKEINSFSGTSISVDPIFVVQVLNAENSQISGTDLSACLSVIEEKTELHFEEGEVVHTFGDCEDITINGLNVKYEKPSSIEDNHNIKVVFFKESLSTGWDCPRAETMMSFRAAIDSTYIAQLLGRMIRSPLHRRIENNDVLNNVELYLPNFDKDTVKKVVDELKRGENIVSEIREEDLGHQSQTLTVRIPQGNNMQTGPLQGQQPQGGTWQQPQEGADQIPSYVYNDPDSIVSQVPNISGEPAQQTVEGKNIGTGGNITSSNQVDVPISTIDRIGITKFINDNCFLTYQINRGERINYRKALFKLVRLINNYDLDGHCRSDVFSTPTLTETYNEIAEMIKKYIEKLKDDGSYDDNVLRARKFRLDAQIVDALGNPQDNVSPDSDLFSVITDRVIDAQVQRQTRKLGDEGICNAYGNYVGWDDPNDPIGYQVEFLLFADNIECLEKYAVYAEEKYNRLKNTYRTKIATSPFEQLREDYRKIVSSADSIGEYSFRLPEVIRIPDNDDAPPCSDHLFVNEETGTVRIKLDGWETATIEEERRIPGFVCWIRNQTKYPWLCIPYKYNGEIKRFYPDFIIVRRDENNPEEYVISILEPHGEYLDDNLAKARALAEYVNNPQNPSGLITRIQLIRKINDPCTGNMRLMRLDMANPEVNKLVLSDNTVTSEDLNNIFMEKGIYEDRHTN